MSKINNLIKELCPNGVEYKTIKETFDLFSGMTGVSNKWANEGNCQFIDYMNAYKNNKIDIKNTPYATVKNLKQNELKKGDLLLTSASEVPDECAVSSVIEDDIKSGIFMDDHLFGLRLKEKYINKINTTFVNYCLNSRPFRNKLFKAVRGVTRFYISNDNYIKLLIPIPPIKVQEEIVKILDKFEELEVELEVELEARKSQYEFWRKKVFELDAPTKKLKDISKVIDSLHETPKYVSEGYPMIRVADVKFGYVDISKTLKVTKEDYDKFISKYKPIKDDIIISRVGSFGNICLVGNEEVCLGQNTSIIHSNINSKYLYYYLSSDNVQNWIKENVNGAGYKSLSLANINEIPIKVPPIFDQERIVNILEKFDEIINSLSVGLPAEIKLRRQQYEYYRNKLLSFEELKNER